MSRTYERKTFVREKGVVVSTVNHDLMIGWDYTAETLVFPADGLGNIAEFRELYGETHGINPSKEELDAAHERIVRGIREGSIELYNHELVTGRTNDDTDFIELFDGLFHDNSTSFVIRKEDYLFVKQKGSATVNVWKLTPTPKNFTCYTTSSNSQDPEVFEKEVEELFPSAKEAWENGWY